MGKTSRNAPCPCGSGKKYKRCCLDNVIDFPQTNAGRENIESPSQLLELVKKELGSRQFGSLEELNQELGTLYKQQNSFAQPAFLGLSPNHMQSILYTPFKTKNEIFEFSCDDNSKLREVPLVKQSLYFLNRLTQGEMKATKLGNLPRAFVIDLYFKFFSEDRFTMKPNREDDLSEATRLKYLLETSGLVKKRNNKFSLTKKGEVLLKKNDVQSLYEMLLLGIVNKWNWAYSDNYSELGLIQMSAIFNFYLLHQKAQDWTHSDELGELYLKAFPALVNEAGGYFGPEREIIQCFSTRFLERISVPLGLALEKRENDKIGGDRFYKVSPFFEQHFVFSRFS